MKRCGECENCLLSESGYEFPCQTSYRPGRPGWKKIAWFAVICGLCGLIVLSGAIYTIKHSDKYNQKADYKQPLKNHGVSK